jgi:hypothetical protein
MSFHTLVNHGWRQAGEFESAETVACPRVLRSSFFNFLFEHFGPSDRLASSTRLAVWLHQFDSAFGFCQSRALSLTQTIRENAKAFDGSLCTWDALPGTGSDSLGQVSESEQVLKFELLRFNVASAFAALLANQGCNFLDCPILQERLNQFRLLATKVVGDLEACHRWISIGSGKLYCHVELFKLGQLWHDFTRTHSRWGVSLSIHLASLAQGSVIRTPQSTVSVLFPEAA